MGILFAFSSLPVLKFDGKPPIALREFYSLIDLNLDAKQKEELSAFRRMIDIKNILSFQTGVRFDAKGNFLEGGLRLSLTSGEYLPGYITDFLEVHKGEKELLRVFPELHALFYQVEIAKGGVLAKFLSFERDLTLILLAMNAKKRKGSIAEYLQFEDPARPLVAALLAQDKGVGRFIFPYEYSELEKQLLSAGSDPMKQYISYALYKYHFYGDVIENTTGSFEALCAYMMCLWILEEKASLDEKKGREILTDIVENDYE